MIWFINYYQKYINLNIYIYILKKEILVVISSMELFQKVFIPWEISKHCMLYKYKIKKIYFKYYLYYLYLLFDTKIHRFYIEI